MKKVFILTLQLVIMTIFSNIVISAEINTSEFVEIKQINTKDTIQATEFIQLIELDSRKIYMLSLENNLEFNNTFYLYSKNNKLKVSLNTNYNNITNQQLYRNIIGEYPLTVIKPNNYINEPVILNFEIEKKPFHPGLYTGSIKLKFYEFATTNEYELIDEKEIIIQLKVDNTIELIINNEHFIWKEKDFINHSATISQTINNSIKLNCSTKETCQKLQLIITNQANCLSKTSELTKLEFTPQEKNWSHIINKTSSKNISTDPITAKKCSNLKLSLLKKNDNLN